MLSLDSDGVRAQLVSIMSDGQTGDWRPPERSNGVAVWSCGVASKVNTGRGVMELTRTLQVSQ